MKRFEGNYSAFLEQQRRQERDFNEANEPKSSRLLQDSGPSRISTRSSQEAESSSSQATENSKPRRRSFKESRELEALNIDIPLLEAKRSNLEAALSGGDEDLTLLSQQLAELIETLHRAEERWLELSELAI